MSYHSLFPVLLGFCFELSVVLSMSLAIVLPSSFGIYAALFILLSPSLNDSLLWKLTIACIAGRIMVAKLYVLLQMLVRYVICESELVLCFFMG